GGRLRLQAGEMAVVQGIPRPGAATDPQSMTAAHHAGAQDRRRRRARRVRTERACTCPDRHAHRGGHAHCASAPRIHTRTCTRVTALSPTTPGRYSKTRDMHRVCVRKAPTTGRGLLVFQATYEPRQAEPPIP